MLFLRISFYPPYDKYLLMQEKDLYLWIQSIKLTQKTLCIWKNKNSPGGCYRWMP